MARIRALFGAQQIQSVFDRFQEDLDNKTLTVLQYMGEQFVNKARLNDTYKDNTGNLRSSIGYIIIKDGAVIDNNFEGNNQGVSKGQEVASKVSTSYPKGYVLIGVAGMDYAAYVEAKSYDVITGSAPTSQELKSIFNEIKP